MSLWEVEMLLTSHKSEYDKRSGEAISTINALKDSLGQVKSLEARIEYLDQISSILNSYADERQAEVQSQIEGVVTSGLNTIFGESFKFRIENKMVGRRSEVDFVLVSDIDGVSLETSILDARGGGVAAVAGFLLQATIVLLTPGIRPTLFLDEVFSQVSEEYLPALSEFIKDLVDKTDLQVVLVTHSTVFSEDADKVYRFKQVKGITSAEEVT